MEYVLFFILYEISFAFCFFALIKTKGEVRGSKYALPSIIAFVISFIAVLFFVFLVIDSDSGQDHTLIYLSLLAAAAFLLLLLGKPGKKNIINIAAIVCSCVCMGIAAFFIINSLKVLFHYLPLIHRTHHRIEMMMEYCLWPILDDFYAIPFLLAFAAAAILYFPKTIKASRAKVPAADSVPAQAPVPAQTPAPAPAKAPSPAQVPAAAPAPVYTEPSPLEKLENFAKLYKDGVITEEEYNKKKAELLSQL